jgi:hypothetical protein
MSPMTTKKKTAKKKSAATSSKATSAKKKAGAKASPKRSAAKAKAKAKAKATRKKAAAKKTATAKKAAAKAAAAPKVKVTKDAEAAVEAKVTQPEVAAPAATPPKKAAEKPAPPKKRPARPKPIPLLRVPHPKFGFKFECFECHAKFYDLNKPDPICPKCGCDQRDRPQAVSEPLPKKKRKRKIDRPMAPLLDEEDARPRTTEGFEDAPGAVPVPTGEEMFDDAVTASASEDDIFEVEDAPVEPEVPGSGPEES